MSKAYNSDDNNKHLLGVNREARNWDLGFRIIIYSREYSVFTQALHSNITANAIM